MSYHFSSGFCETLETIGLTVTDIVVSRMKLTLDDRMFVMTFYYLKLNYYLCGSVIFTYYNMAVGSYIDIE